MTIDSPHVERVAALDAGLEEAIAARVAAEASLATARAETSEGIAQWMRDKIDNPDAKPPVQTIPKAEKAVEDAKQTAVAALKALQQENALLAADVTARRDDILKDLAARDDELTLTIDGFITQVEEALAEKADIMAHRVWTARPEGQVGRPQPRAEKEVAALRKAVTGEETETYKVLHERDVDAWKDIVEKATATVPREQRQSVLDSQTGFQTVPAIDAAIEVAVAQFLEDGGELPSQGIPEKWQRKLDIGKFARNPVAA